MSKPDPAGGSLESILASIRKSLSEQSTDALSETPALSASPDNDAKSTRRHGLTQRLAGAAAGTASGEGGERDEDDLSDLLEAPSAVGTEPIAGAAAPAAASSTTETPPSGEGPAGKDPLWFLTRRDQVAVTETGTPSGAGAAGQAAEPKLTRPEVLRASMPPFFGSSSDGVLPATAPVEAAAPVAGASKPAATQGAAPATRVTDPALEQEVSRVAAAAETAAARPHNFDSSSRLNGKAQAEPEPAKSAILAGDTPHNRALEAMVLDLLKPMLRQWLDENMPRLVAEALSEEVQRTRAAKADANKT